MAITNYQCQYHYYFYIFFFTITVAVLVYIYGRTIQTPSIRYNPSHPKFNALAPRDERKQTPNITFGNRRAETLRFGGAGIQHSACCRD